MVAYRVSLIARTEGRMRSSRVLYQVVTVSRDGAKVDLFAV